MSTTRASSVLTGRGGEVGARLHRAGAGPSVRAADARWREAKHQRDVQPERYRQFVQMLRREVSEAEHPLVGFEEVCDWLDRMGIVNRHGGRVAPHVVKDWRARLGLPMMRGRCAWPGRYRASHIWTTNLALTAWLLSLYRSGGPRLPNVRASNHCPTSGHLKGARPGGRGYARVRR